MELTSNMVEDFTQHANTILDGWEAAIQRYREFKQQTMAVVLELDPLFETGKPKKDESAIGADTTLQALVEAKEAPTQQSSEPTQLSM